MAEKNDKPKRRHVMPEDTRDPKDLPDPADRPFVAQRLGTSKGTTRAQIFRGDNGAGAGVGSGGTVKRISDEDKKKARREAIQAMRTQEA